MKIACRQIMSVIIISCLSPLVRCNNSPKGETGPIEGKIKFSITEGYEHDSIMKPKVMISMATEKIYGCCNFGILYDLKRLDNTIFIDLIGIYMPLICLTALGPARATQFLDLAEGEYGLCFGYHNLADGYRFVISDSSIEVEGNNPELTSLDLDLSWRYPDNSFVYLCGTMIETRWICDDFLDTLLSKIPLTEFEFPDFGKTPFPESSQGHYYDMPARYFFYEKEEDFDQAGEVLKTYTKNVISQYSGVGISLINWKNKRFFSWLFED